MVVDSFYQEKQHPRYFSTARTEILSLVPHRSDRVLEIGCGEGSTLRFLKEKGLAAWTCGVDLNEEALRKAAAAGVDKTIYGDLNSALLDFGHETFDLILCLDVLEHLIDPWSTLKQLRAFLRPGGVLIASIPNVQNLRVVAPLVIGRWQYRDCGILDKSHLRFFTRSSAIDLIGQAGLTVEACEPVVEQHWLPRALNFLTLRGFQRFVTVQYLLRAKRETS